MTKSKHNVYMMLETQQRMRKWADLREGEEEEKKDKEETEEKEEENDDRDKKDK